MKRAIIIFCLILTVMISGARAQTATKMFKGSIGSAKFQMTLTRDGDKISGNYFYEKSGSANKLNLRGEIQPDGNFTLVETDASGKQTGVFKGTWKDDETTSGAILDGNWSKPQGAETYFTAVEQSIYLTDGLSIATRNIKEKNLPKLFEIEVGYPQIVGSNAAGILKFNLRAKEITNKPLAQFKKDMLAQTAEDLKYIKKVGMNYMDIGFDIAYATNDFASVQFSDSVFTGGAHPNYFTFTLNYDLKNNRELSLADLFKPKSDYLKVISEYCIARLKAQTEEMTDDEWLKNGAGADAKNFKSWNITEKGLMINFDPYQVAAYAAGPQTVIIPFEKLKDILSENFPAGVLQK
ncbi:MAG: DUF3298 domain-containing protein [Pyrinomonadaceae bacterium]